MKQGAVSKSVAIEQLLELMRIAGGHAAAAFADLVGRACWMRAPRALWCPQRGAESPRQRSTGVLFEVEGSLQGVLALQLRREALEALAARLLGGRPARRELLESALCELGNVVVSHVCSAIADTLAARLVPSPPLLLLEDGESGLVALAARRGGGRLRIEAEIVDAEGEPQGRLVFVPDP